MHRQEKIEQFTDRLIKHLGLEAKIAYMQLSNVFRYEGLVDFCFGMYFDEDALSLVRDNVVFRLENKDGQLVAVKPQPMDVFQRMIDKLQVKISPREQYMPPISSQGNPDAERNLNKGSSEEERAQSTHLKKDNFETLPKGMHRLLLVCVPEGATEQ